MMFRTLFLMYMGVLSFWAISMVGTATTTEPVSLGGAVMFILVMLGASCLASLATIETFSVPEDNQP